MIWYHILPYLLLRLVSFYCWIVQLLRCFFKIKHDFAPYFCLILLFNSHKAHIFQGKKSVTTQTSRVISAGGTAHCLLGKTCSISNAFWVRVAQTLVCFLSWMKCQSKVRVSGKFNNHLCETWETCSKTITLVNEYSFYFAALSVINQSTNVCQHVT